MKLFFKILMLLSSANLFASNVIEFNKEFYSYRTVCYGDDAKIEIYRIEDISINNRTLNSENKPSIKNYEECTANPKNIGVKKYTKQDIEKIISENSDFWED